MCFESSFKFKWCFKFAYSILICLTCIFEVIVSYLYLILARLRKPLEKLRPPSVSELLLSNDGDRILEGSVTNFFVVCRKVC